MYFMKPSPRTSTRVLTAIIASSWTEPDLQELELNIWRSAFIIGSDIWGASSGVIFRSTLCWNRQIDYNIRKIKFKSDTFVLVPCYDYRYLTEHVCTMIETKRRGCMPRITPTWRVAQRRPWRSLNWARSLWLWICCSIARTWFNLSRMIMVVFWTVT